MINFVRIPKNASTSIYYHITEMNTISNEKTDSLKDTKYLKSMPTSHCTLSQAVEIMGKQILENPTFAVCRNPYDRMVSMYHNALKEKHNKKLGVTNFEQFVDFCMNEDTIASLSQSDYLDLDIYVDILRFENLQKDWKTFLIKHKIAINPRLPHKHKSNRKDWKSYYNTSIKEKVAQLWRNDFTRFNYAL